MPREEKKEEVEILAMAQLIGLSWVSGRLEKTVDMLNRSRPNLRASEFPEYQCLKEAIKKYKQALFERLVETRDVY